MSSDLPVGQQSKELAGAERLAFEVIDTSPWIAGTEVWNLARAVVAALDLPAREARVRAQALMDARDDLARTAERLERKGREPGGRQHLGTAAGVRLACFRLIELADAAQKDAGKGLPGHAAALPDVVGTPTATEARDAG